MVSGSLMSLDICRFEVYISFSMVWLCRFSVVVMLGVLSSVLILCLVSVLGRLCGSFGCLIRWVGLLKFVDWWVRNL